MEEENNNSGLKLKILTTPIHSQRKETTDPDLNNSSINDNDRTIEEEFDDILDRPADIEMAQKHGLANRIYKIDYKKIRETEEIEETCRCCGRFVPDGKLTREYPYMTPIDEIATDIGPGIYLYLFYIKFAIFFTFVAFFMCGMPQIIYIRDTYFELKSYCEKYNTTKICWDFNEKVKIGVLYSVSYENLYNYRDLADQLAKDTEDELFPNFSFISFLILCLSYPVCYILIIVAGNLSNLIDISKTSASDYTLMISNLPSDCKDVDDLKKNITFSGIAPHHINLTYKVGEYFTLKHRYLEQKKKIDFCHANKTDVYKSCFKRESLADLKKSISAIEKQTSFLAELMKKNLFDKTIFANTAFITFKTQREASQYLRNFPRTVVDHIFLHTKHFFLKFCCRFCSNKENFDLLEKKIMLEVIRAPEPDDIIWQNLHFTYEERLTRYVIIHSSSALIVVGGFLVIYILSFYQTDIKETNLFIKYSISFLITIAISITNYILDRVLFFLTEYEKNRTFTKFYLSQSLKLTGLTFFNTALTPLLVSIVNGKFFTNKELLMQNLLVIFLSNSFVTPLTYLIPPTYVAQWIQRKLTLKKFNSNAEIKLTQKQANDLFENPGISIAYKFSYLAKTLLLTFFYLPFFPLGSLISAFGLIFVLLVERHNILRFYRIPETLNEEIGLRYMNLFKFCMFLMAASDCLFIFKLFEDYKWLWINLSISLIMLPIPFIYLVPDIIGVTEEELNDFDYDDIYLTLHEDYERANPITKKFGLQRFVEVLKNNELITSETFLKLMTDIDNKQSDNIDNYYSSNENFKMNLLHQQQTKFLSIVNKNISKEAEIENRLSRMKTNVVGFSKKPSEKPKQFINPFLASHVVSSISTANNNFETTKKRNKKKEFRSFFKKVIREETKKGDQGDEFDLKCIK